MTIIDRHLHSLDSVLAQLDRRHLIAFNYLVCLRLAATYRELQRGLATYREQQRSPVEALVEETLERAWQAITDGRDPADPMAAQELRGALRDDSSRQRELYGDDALAAIAEWFDEPATELARVPLEMLDGILFDTLDDYQPGVDDDQVAEHPAFRRERERQMADALALKRNGTSTETLESLRTLSREQNLFQDLQLDE